MYEYNRKARRTGGMYGLGTDDVTPGMQLALDYRSGVKTRAEIERTCLGVAPSRYHTDYDECRWFLTPEDLCRREQGHTCSEEELRQQCFLTPANLRHNRCFFYMSDMTREDVTASNEGPEVEPSVLQQATGAVAGYRNRVADAAESIVRTLRPVDPDVQAVQGAILAVGCTLPRYGADGRWGTETETGVRCLADRQSWNTVMLQYPWLAQRMQVPTQRLAEAPATTKPSSGAVVSVAQVMPAVTPGTTQQTASMFSSMGLPTWAPWAILGVGFFSIFTFGLYLARGLKK